MLLFVAGCFQPEPLLPPHEALAKTAQRIQQIIEEERKVPIEPRQFPQETPANSNEVVFWFCAHPLISHAMLAHPERVEAFQSAHPGLKLNHQFIGDWSVAIQKLTVSLAAGEVPDVALVKRPWLARLIDSGWVAPLDDLLPPTLLADFQPVALAPLGFAGHLYALPADGFCLLRQEQNRNVRGNDRFPSEEFRRND
ncbi:MAG: extracellular solute-binding protein [Candidatus Hydrogenedentes bacterium]|nr:extracellular solute-binding protein [Candidatus Hydrogenedentota bacterium]